MDDVGAKLLPLWQAVQTGSLPGAPAQQGGLSRRVGAEVPPDLQGRGISGGSLRGLALGQGNLTQFRLGGDGQGARVRRQAQCRPGALPGGVVMAFQAAQGRAHLVAAGGVRVVPPLQVQRRGPVQFRAGFLETALAHQFVGVAQQRLGRDVGFRHGPCSSR